MPNNTLHSPNKSDPKNPPLTALSLFAGVGGFDRGLERAGVRVIAQSEIDPHAASVLRRHWPDVPLVPDVTTVNGADYPADIVTGGFPCQDLSVAGKRSGLAGERSGLFYEIVRIVHEMREATDGKYPRWVVLENVVGAFSSNGGADFAAVLESLVGGEVRRPTGGWAYAGVAFGPLGSLEWRVLDSQHFGVAQRRRRVFVVYHPGSERAGAVLLEPQGVRGDSPSRRAPGEDLAPSLSARASYDRGDGSEPIVPVIAETVSKTLTAGAGLRYDPETETLLPVLNDQGGSVMNVTYGLTATLRAAEHGHQPKVPVPVAFKVRGGVEVDSAGKSAGKGYLGSEDKALTLGASQDQYLAEPLAFRQKAGATAGLSEGPLALTLEAATPAHAVAFALRGREDGATPEVSGDRTIATPYAVRRLTPKECCRLQGFPDEWTRYAADGTEIADTHRYRMMGNAVSVPVAEWIAHRLKEALS